jgi:transposase-like protein
MLYCPSCNNTHWYTTKNVKVLAFLRLKKELKCGKCNKIVLGSIFLSTENGRKRSVTVCPSCKTSAVRSRRKGVERLLFFLRAYRCQACKIRFRKLQLTD